MFSQDVLCIGSATVDQFLTVKNSLKSIRLGDKILVSSREIHSGGGAANSAAALSKLGLKTKVLIKLGDDHDADFILKELQQYRVKNICLHRSQKGTDHATIISSDQERDRVIYVYKGASQELNPADFKKSQLKAKWIYLATCMGKSLQTAKEIAAYAQKNNISLLFNPSLYLAEKGKKYLRPFLQAAQILVLNKEEAQALLNKRVDTKKLLKDLSALSPKIVVITDGPRKLFAISENTIYTLVPPDIRVVHTAGAGDAFTAGFLAGIIKNYPLEKALQIGQANSSSVIQHLGTKNRLLTLKEAEQFIKKYPMRITKTKC